MASYESVVPLFKEMPPLREHPQAQDARELYFSFMRAGLNRLGITYEDHADVKNSIAEHLGMSLKDLPELPFVPHAAGLPKNVIRMPARDTTIGKKKWQY